MSKSQLQYSVQTQAKENPKVSTFCRVLNKNNNLLDNSSTKSKSPDSLIKLPLRFNENNSRLHLKTNPYDSYYMLTNSDRGQANKEKTPKQTNYDKNSTSELNGKANISIQFTLESEVSC